MPAALKGIPWDLIQDAICNHGLTYDEVAQRHGVKAVTIRQRAIRHKWPIPSVVTNRLKDRALAHVTKVSRNELLTTQKVDIWAERQAEIRDSAYKLSSKALKRAIKHEIPVKNWSDLTQAHEMARKATGLDKQEQASVNPFGFVVTMFQQANGAEKPAIDI